MKLLIIVSFILLSASFSNSQDTMIVLQNSDTIKILKLTDLLFKVRDTHKFYELARIKEMNYNDYLKIIRVNSCNQWQKIASKFKADNLSKLTDLLFKVRDIHEFHELARIKEMNYNDYLKIIRVNSCNQWQKIASKFKAVNLSKLTDLLFKVRDTHEFHELARINDMNYNELLK